LPAYSPQLNLIEILWRFIKYQWLEFSAYKDWNSLVEAVENISTSPKSVDAQKS
jgi:DDE superfamily endonuclease